MTSYAFQAVTNAFPSVDTFFLLSGCLVTYLTLKELDKTNGRLNWIMFYVHRYLRYIFKSVISNCLELDYYILAILTHCKRANNCLNLPLVFSVMLAKEAVYLR